MDDVSAEYGRPLQCKQTSYGFCLLTRKKMQKQLDRCCVHVSDIHRICAAFITRSLHLRCLSQTRNPRPRSNLPFPFLYIYMFSTSPSSSLLSTHKDVQFNNLQKNRHSCNPRTSTILVSANLHSNVTTTSPKLSQSPSLFPPSSPTQP